MKVYHLLERARPTATVPTDVGAFARAVRDGLPAGWLFEQRSAFGLVTSVLRNQAGTWVIVIDGADGSTTVQVGGQLVASFVDFDVAGIVGLATTQARVEALSGGAR